MDNINYASGYAYLLTDEILNNKDDIMIHLRELAKHERFDVINQLKIHKDLLYHDISGLLHNFFITLPANEPVLYLEFLLELGADQDYNYDGGLRLTKMLVDDYKIISKPDRIRYLEYLDVLKNYITNNIIDQVIIYINEIIINLENDRYVVNKKLAKEGFEMLLQVLVPEIKEPGFD